MSRVSKIVSNIICNHQQKAIQALQNGQLDKLDPHVGDTSCQIRAIAMIDFYKYRDTKDWLEFITLSYILSKFKVNIYANDSVIMTMIIDLKKMKKELNIGKDITNKCLHFMQSRLSTLSIKYIQLLAKELEYKNLQDALTVIATDNTKRKLCACYPVTKTILLYCLKIKVSLLIEHYIQGKKEIFFYQPMEQKYVLSQLPENTNIPILVITTVSQNKIPLENVMQLILANAAQHKQFSNNANMELPSLTEEMSVLKEYAVKNGITQEKQDSFFIRHIYSLKLSSFLAIEYSELLNIYLKREITNLIIEYF